MFDIEVAWKQGYSSCAMPEISDLRRAFGAMDNSWSTHLALTVHAYLTTHIQHHSPPPLRNMVINIQKGTCCFGF